MSDRMTDERLALFDSFWRCEVSLSARSVVDELAGELHAALRWERGRVVRLEAALTDILNVQGFPASTRLPPALMDAVGHAKAVLAEGATT